MLVLLLAACNGTDPDWEPPDVVINELVASNASGLQDASGAFPDWFELHNLGADDVDLSSWTVTDDPALPQKWSFPAGSVIEAGEYLVIFADGDPSTTDEIHTSFRLSAGGETLTLIGPAEQDLPSIDAVAFSVQTTDVAFARMPDGVGAFTEDDTPTPGAMNE
jgi:hypothetical protein